LKLTTTKLIFCELSSIYILNLKEEDFWMSWTKAIDVEVDQEIEMEAMIFNRFLPSANDFGFKSKR